MLHCAGTLEKWTFWLEGGKNPQQKSLVSHSLAPPSILFTSCFYNTRCDVKSLHKLFTPCLVPAGSHWPHVWTVLGQFFFFVCVDLGGLTGQPRVYTLSDRDICHAPPDHHTRTTGGLKYIYILAYREGISLELQQGILLVFSSIILSVILIRYTICMFFI